MAPEEGFDRRRARRKWKAFLTDAALLLAGAVILALLLAALCLG